jgi:hypothetical protein
MNENNTSPHEWAIEMTKKLIHNNLYGKFDLLERLIPQEKLLYEKTRILLLEITLLLDIPVEELPYDNFKMWISRYRKMNGKRLATPAIQEKKENKESASLQKKVRRFIKAFMN